MMISQFQSMFSCLQLRFSLNSVAPKWGLILLEWLATKYCFFSYTQTVALAHACASCTCTYKPPHAHKCFKAHSLRALWLKTWNAKFMNKDLFPTSPKASKWANKWAKRAVRSKRMNQQGKRMSEWRSEWHSTKHVGFIVILANMHCTVIKNSLKSRC